MNNQVSRQSKKRVKRWYVGLVAGAMALTACSGGSGPARDIDAFLATLPAWTEVAPPVVETDGQPTGEAPVVTEEISESGTVYTCTTTPYSISKNPTEMALHNPDAAVLWPGALIRGSSHLNLGSLELLAVAKERRAPLGISIQGGGVLGIPGGVSAIVAQPVGSTVREGINQLVVNALGADVAVGAGASTFTSVESHSSTQVLLSLGLDARYLGGEVSASLDYSKGLDETTYTAYFVQRLFTLAVDLPEQPSSLFATGVTGADLASLGIGPDNLPLYIDTVSYGRILMFSFTSSDRRERIEAALEFAYNAVVGGVDGYAEAQLEETLSNARIEVFALGGPNTGVQGLIRDASLASYFEAPLAINQVEPISFTIRNLGDNSLAKVGDVTTYDVRECLPLNGGLPEPAHWWPADGDYDDAVGDVTLGGNLGTFGAGWNGADPSNRAFVLNGDNQYLNTFPTLQTVPADGPFTVVAWINPRRFDGVRTIVSQVGGALLAGDFGFRARGDTGAGRLDFWRRPSDASTSVDLVTTGNVIGSNQWSHVAAVYGAAGGGSSMSIYVDGKLSGSSVVSDNYSPGQLEGGPSLTMTRVGSSELYAPGGLSGPRFVFDGALDEVMVFDRALSAEEIAAMYQNAEDYQH